MESHPSGSAKVQVYIVQGARFTFGGTGAGGEGTEGKKGVSGVGGLSSQICKYSIPDKFK